MMNKFMTAYHICNLDTVVINNFKKWIFPYHNKNMSVLIICILIFYITG